MTIRAHLEGQVFADHVAGSTGDVVALHGWGRSRADVVGLVNPWGGLAIDLPGHGASPPPPEAWGSGDYADAVAKVLDEDPAPRPRLVVAHSFGGRVAAHLGATRPDLVAGIVFVGVPLLRRPGTGRAAPAYRLVRTLHRRGLVSDARMAAAREKHGSLDYRAAQGVMRDVLVRLVNEDYRYQLAALTCPVGFCWGADDTAAPAWVAEEASQVVARSVEVDLVLGIGHDVHIERPDRVAAVMGSVRAAASQGFPS